jgi:hypothetical protein
MSNSSKLLTLILLAAVAAAVFLAAGRMRIEARNHIVEVVVDADDVRRVAAGQSGTGVLAQFRRVGATAVGVREMTIDELLRAGVVAVGHFPGGVSLEAPDPGYAAALAEAIRGKFVHVAAFAEGATVRIYGAGLDLFREVPLLLRPEDVEAAHAAGLRVVARLGNYANITPKAIGASLGQAQRDGARLVVFRDDQVLGYRSSLKLVAGSFETFDMLYGRIEIAQQKGDDELARLLPGHRLRVHSINDTEIETMAPVTAIERYARAVRERGIRVCHVRLLTDSDSDPLGANLRYVSDVVQAIRQEGFRTGPPVPLSAPEGWPPRAARLAALLGVAAGATLLLTRLAPLTSGQSWALFIGAAVVLGGLGLVAMGRAMMLGGVLAAAAFPSLGVVWALQWARRGRLAPGTGEVLRRAAAGLLLASALSLAGGLLIVALYAEPRYLEGVGQFTGVKLSLVIPPLLVLVAVALDLSGDPQPMSGWYEAARSRWRAFCAAPVAWGAALLLAVGLAAAAVVLMRSGNTSAIAPTGAELQMRHTLETLLIARPRTKEFLLGHPAMMLAIALVLRGRRTWLAVVAVIAAVGQASLLNTFCHFHMPLYLGLLRSIHGLWIGGLLGAAAILIWQAARVRTPQVAR